MPTRSMTVPTSQRLRRLVLVTAGWALGLVALGGCDSRNPDLVGFYFPYEVVVEDFRSPCPAKCATLPFQEYGDAGVLWTSRNYDDPYVLGAEDTGRHTLDFSGPIVVQKIPEWSRVCGLGNDCDCELQVFVEARPTVALLNLRVRSLPERSPEYVLNFTPSDEEENDWNFELIGEFPMPLPASDYDPSYEQQEFHLVGYPDEYIEAEPDSCTDDLRSLRFDLRLTPLLPYHMQ